MDSNDTEHNRVAVVGAGVIGRVYAGRLASAGHRVWLLARGDTLAGLSADGLRLVASDVAERPAVTVVGDAADIPSVDVTYLAVRADQLDAALPVLDRITTETVVTLGNLGADVDAVTALTGVDRTVLGFPGVGGRRSDGGVEYHEVGQQHTTIGTCGGRENRIAHDLRRAGFAVDVVGDMPDWLATHTVFIAGIGAAILRAGDSEALGADRGRTAAMVLSVRDGFTALTRRGITVTPRPLRTIFTRIPAMFSVPYWQRQMRGDLGRLALAPHITATRDTEFLVIADAARRLTDGSPRLAAALDAVVSRGT